MYILIHIHVCMYVYRYMYIYIDIYIYVYICIIFFNPQLVEGHTLIIYIPAKASTSKSVSNPCHVLYKYRYAYIIYVA